MAQGPNIEHPSRDLEAVEEFGRPLTPQPGRREDEDPIDDADGAQLRDEQPGLNRLPEPHIVGKKYANTEAAEDRQGRDQLVGQEINSGVTGATKGARRHLHGDEPPTRLAPAPS
jgi:hypothetical protein